MTEAPPPTPEAMKPRRGWLGRSILVLALLSIVFVGLWGFVPTHVDEEVSANLRVTKGQVLFQRQGQSEWRSAKGIASLGAKSSVRVEAGGEAFLVHLDGGMSRLTGPVEVELVESRRTIEGPSTLGGVLVRLLGKEPTGHTKVRTSTTLRPVAGTIIARASSSPSSLLTLAGPNYYALVSTGAAFRTNLAPGKETWWESLKGTTSLSMVSVRDEVATPVAIPALAPGNRILMPAIPPEHTTNPKVLGLSQKLAKALPSLKGNAPTSVEGMTFQPVADTPGLPYLVGESIRLGAEPATPGPAPALQTVPAEAPAVEGLLAVPGAEVRSITDKEIEGHLPSGMKAHLAAGNVVEVTYGGMVYTVRVSVVGGRVEFSGLPLGIDPGPQLERFATDIPAIFSLETSEGEARVTYFPGEKAPEPAAPAGPGEAPTLPHATPYFSSISTPDEVSTDWKVVGTNGLFAAWAMLLVRIPTTLAGTMLRTQEENLKRLFSPLGRTLGALARTPRAIFAGASKLPAPRAIQILALLLLYGLIFSFLDKRFTPWAGKGLNVLPIITLSTALVGQIDPMVRSMLLSRWGVSHFLGAYPANLALALGSVAFSRVASLSPGILVGTPGGLKASSLKDEQKYILTLWGLGAVFAVGIAAWTFTYVLPRLSSWGGAATVLASLKGPTSFLQDMALLIFTAALTRVFFALLPLPQGAGATIWKRSKALWLISFGVAAFIFFHALLNRNSSLAQLMEERGPLVLGMIGFSMLLAVVAVVYSRRRK